VLNIRDSTASAASWDSADRENPICADKLAYRRFRMTASYE